MNTLSRDHHQKEDDNLEGIVWKLWNDWTDEQINSTIQSDGKGPCWLYGSSILARSSNESILFNLQFTIQSLVFLKEIYDIKEQKDKLVEKIELFRKAIKGIIDDFEQAGKNLKETCWRCREIMKGQ